ncbi:MAG TPA: hypothetical protein VK540_35370 [Polyangiaceae bacterium]|nr:hypothetical protein [Polyangiaceae bacterium]
MHCRRLKPWLLVVGLVACAEREPAARPIDTTPPGTTTTLAGGAGGAGGSGGAGAGSPDDGASRGGSGGSGGAVVGDANVESGSFDVAPHTPLVIIHPEGSSGGAACANNFTALGSNRLLAGGATPPDFAAAYNIERAASNTAGALLLAFYGVNDTNLLGWVASVGALGPSDAGAGVGFAGVHAEVPFTLASNRSLHMAFIAADFELRLVTPATSVSLPIGAIALDGSLSVGCGSLTVEKARLLVPIRAGTLAFHGSTVEALMGPPTETLRGVARSAWPLELSGKASQVYAPGLLGDSGIEP